MCSITAGEGIYSLDTAGHQFKYRPNTLKQLLCNNDLVYALILF